MSVNLQIQIQGLDKLKKGFEKAPKETFNQLTKAINKSALVITQRIKTETPVKSGTLKRGIRPTFGRLKAIIQPHNAPYAKFVHEGTKGYIIRPKNKKALFWPGALHPVKSVRHPGIKSNPFMERGLDKSKREVEEIFKNGINKVLKVITK